MDIWDRFRKWIGASVEANRELTKDQAAAAAQFSMFLEQEGLGPEQLLAQRNELVRRARALLFARGEGGSPEEIRAAQSLHQLCNSIVPKPRLASLDEIDPVKDEVDYELITLPESKKYDSRVDTLVHIQRVRELLRLFWKNLMARGAVHDQSKLISPENDVFDEFTPKLKDCTYGSTEYHGFLAAMAPALEHHYAENSHHPEHYGFRKCSACGEVYEPAHKDPCKKCGCVQLPLSGRVAGMSLLDVAEMFCDWKAATERHADGSLEKSIKLNKKRFGFSDELAEIFENTRKELGW